MSRRRTAAAVTQAAEQQEEPVTCFCGAAEFAYSFARFPMAHVSRCRKCGFEHRCELKPATPKSPRAPTPPDDPPMGAPPFWY